MNQGQEISGKALGEQGQGDDIRQPEQEAQGTGEQVVTETAQHKFHWPGVGNNARTHDRVGIGNQHCNGARGNEYQRQVGPGKLRAEAEHREDAGSDHGAHRDGGRLQESELLVRHSAVSVLR
ncbi:MAG: hypothetical protein P8X48_08215 [Acidiferrobacteraceae bacterium]